MGVNKINLLITTYYLDKGGVEEIILTYTKLLDKSKYSVTVACLVTGTVSDEIACIDGVRLFHIDTKNRIRRFLKFWKIARETEADIVHNHACWYGLIVGYLVGAKRIETIHNMYHWFKHYERILYGLNCLFANKIIAVSEYVRTFSIDYFPFINTKNTVVIHNGIDFEKFQNDQNKTELREQLSIKKDEIVVGFIGRLTEQKGIEYLIEAALVISKQNPNVKFIIVGDGILRDALENQAHKLGLINIFFTGFQRNVPQHLQLFDIFVLPSLFEGLPVSVLEAFASGTAVVATKVSGTPEVVHDGINGFLVEPKNAKQLAEKLQILINDPILRKKFGENGKNLVKSQFSAELMVKKTEDVYSKLLNR
ncbi:glycosyltransferase family 4 protein [Patescibacteria group bacterium]|nr:glycosyltransferase family 4 protein [Patescibacteria group bacterium]